MSLDENIEEILLQLDYSEILTACQINKQYERVCHQQTFWIKLLLRDFDYDYSNQYNNYDKTAETTYRLFYQLIDRYVLEIISQYIRFRTRYTNLQHVYKELFKQLVDFTYQDFDWDQDGEFEKFRHQHLTIIFNILQIPISDNDKIIHLPPRHRGALNTNQQKWEYMSSEILYHLLNDYCDTI